MARDEPGGDGPQEIYHPERVRPGQRRLVAAGLSGVALVAFAAIVWYAYSEGKRVGSEGIAPLIVADGGPVKVRPEKPGGMAVPHRDKTVYSRIAPDEAEGKVERLLPPPEVPLPRRIAPPPAAPPRTTDAPAAEAKIPEPPKPAPAASEAKAPAVPPKTAVPKAEAPTVAAKPPAPPAPKTSAPTAPAPATASGGYLVQLASLRDRKAANTAWERIKRQHAGLLGNLGPDIARVDLGAKGVWYRVRAGGLADAAAANRLCDALKARKQPCLVVRP